MTDLKSVKAELPPTVQTKPTFFTANQYALAIAKDLSRDNADTGEVLKSLIDNLLIELKLQLEILNQRKAAQLNTIILAVNGKYLTVLRKTKTEKNLCKDSFLLTLFNRIPAFKVILEAGKSANPSKALRKLDVEGISIPNTSEISEGVNVENDTIPKITPPKGDTRMEEVMEEAKEEVKEALAEILVEAPEAEVEALAEILVEAPEAEVEAPLSKEAVGDVKEVEAEVEEVKPEIKKAVPSKPRASKATAKPRASKATARPISKATKR